MCLYPKPLLPTKLSFPTSKSSIKVMTQSFRCVYHSDHGSSLPSRFSRPLSGSRLLYRSARQHCHVWRLKHRSVLSPNYPRCSNDCHLWHLRALKLFLRSCPTRSTESRNSPGRPKFTIIDYQLWRWDLSLWELYYARSIRNNWSHFESYILWDSCLFLPRGFLKSKLVELKWEVE